MTYSEIVSFLWGIADLIRDSFRRGEYQNVILPLTVLRRLDCVLAPTKERSPRNNWEAPREAREPRPAVAQGVRASRSTTRRATTSRSSSPTRRNLAANLRATSPASAKNMRDVLEKFDFDNTIRQARRRPACCFRCWKRFKKVDLQPGSRRRTRDGLRSSRSSSGSSTRRSNENPGEHFTPREVVRLMVDLMLGRRRAATSQKRRCRPHRLRPVLRVGRHAHDRQGAHHRLADRNGINKTPMSTCSARRSTRDLRRVASRTSS